MKLLILFIINISLFAAGNVIGEKVTTQSKPWFTPTELNYPYFKNPNKKGADIKRAPLFSESCDNIAYTGALEDAAIDYLQNTKEYLKELKRPFTGLSSFEKIVFKYSLSYCVSKQIRDYLKTLKRTSKNALGATKGDLYIKAGIYTGNSPWARDPKTGLIVPNRVGSTNVSALKALYHANGLAISDAQSEGFFDQLLNCTFETRRKAIKEMYRIMSWNAKLNIGFISSITSMCSYKLKKQNEKPNWKDLFPQMQEWEDSVNKYVNGNLPKVAGDGEFKFVFGEFTKSKSKCISGQNTLTGKKCATKKEIELTKQLHDNNISFPVTITTQDKIKYFTNQVNTKKHLQVKLKLDNLAKIYFGNLDKTFSDKGLFLPEQKNYRDSLVRIFLKAYDPFITISSLEGSATYNIMDKKEIIGKKAELKFIKNNIDSFDHSKQFTTFNIFFNLIYKNINTYIKEFNIQDPYTKTFYVSIGYKKGKNFDYKRTLESACIKYANYIKGNKIGECHPFYKGIFTFVEMKLHPVMSLDNILTDVEEIMTEQGEDTSLNSMEASKNIVQTRAISDLILNEE